VSEGSAETVEYRMVESWPGMWAVMWTYRTEFGYPSRTFQVPIQGEDMARAWKSRLETDEIWRGQVEYGLIASGQVQGWSAA